MKIEEIEKAMKEAGVDAATITAVKGLDNSAKVEQLTSDLTAEKGKAAQFLTDKKAAIADKETAIAALETAKTDTMSGDEKMQKQIDDLTKGLSDRDKALAEKDAAFAAKERDALVTSISAEQNRPDGVSVSAMKLFVNSALTEIEDLGDGKSEAVVKALDDLKSNNKHLFAADTTAGTGGVHKPDGGGGGGDQALTMKQLMAEVK